MITKLAVKNFKSIGEDGVSIELKPFTILVGPNGSGKSNILEALRLLGQSLGHDGFQYKGPLVSYPNLESILHKNASDRWITIEAHLKPQKPAADRLEPLTAQIREKLNIRLNLKDFGYRYSYKPKTNEVRQSVLSGSKVVAEVARLERDGKARTTYQSPTILAEANTVPSGNPRQILGPAVFEQADKVVEDAMPLTNMAMEMVKLLTSALRDKIFPLSAARGTISYEDVTRGPPSWIGVRGEDLIPVLSIIFTERKYRGISQRISKWAREFGVADLAAGWKGGNVLRSDYEDPKLETLVNLAMAGYGSRQILSVITQLFWAYPNSIFLIEEPEISLHPDSQAKLPELFGVAIQEDKQVIVTTHSEFLILSMARSVKRRLFKPREISVYHVDKSSTGTLARKLKVSKNGYVKGWIPSFAETEKTLFKEWFETVPEEE